MVFNPEQMPPAGKEPGKTKEKPKTRAEMKQEWREHFGPLAEAQLEQEKIERAAKRAEKIKQKKAPTEKKPDEKEEIKKIAHEIYKKREAGQEPGYTWKEIDEMLRRENLTPGTEEARKFLEEWDWFKAEKAHIESAKIPEEKIKTEQILKDVGIEKPAESFEEVQKRLEEKLKNVEEGDRLIAENKFYLSELGYSVRRKGLLFGKAEILDEKGQTITGKDGKPIEFKSFYYNKTEKLINNFLKERLKEKLEGKPAEKMSEDEKIEAGLNKAVKSAGNEQKTREEIISSLADVKKVGRQRLEKVMGGLSYLAALDKLGILGLREVKKLAFEGGKDLMAIGLSPAMAIEEAGREVAGIIQVREALRKGTLAERKIGMIEKIPPEERPEYYTQLLEGIKGTSQRGTDEIIKGYDKMFKKGKILGFLERWGGRFGKAMGERLEPKTR